MGYSSRRPHTVCLEKEGRKVDGSFQKDNYLILLWSTKEWLYLPYFQIDVAIHILQHLFELQLTIIKILSQL